MRKISLLIAALLLVFTATAVDASPVRPDAAVEVAAPDAMAHTDAQAWNYCHWFDAVWWGLEPNNATKIRWRSVHYLGLHLIECCYSIYPYGIRAHGIYDIGYNTWTWLPGDAWCPN